MTMLPPNPTGDPGGIVELLTGIKSSIDIATGILDTMAFREAARLPGRVVESGAVISGQQVSKLTTASRTVILAQTNDVEIIEGMYATVTNLSANGIVAASLQLTDDIVFPMTFQSSSPFVFLSPMDIPVQQSDRVLTVTSANGTYSSVSVVMWGHVAPARTRTVH